MGTYAESTAATRTARRVSKTENKIGRNIKKKKKNLLCHSIEIISDQHLDSEDQKISMQMLSELVSIDSVCEKLPPQLLPDKRGPLFNKNIHVIKGPLHTSNSPNKHAASPQNIGKCPEESMAYK